MTRVMKAELFKNKFLGYFYWPLLIPVVLVLFKLLMIPLLGDDLGGKQSFSIISLAGEFSLTNALASFLPETFFITSACMVAYYVSNEYKTKTMKNLICSGNTRTQIYMGKLLSSEVSLIVLFFINMIILGVAGLIAGGVGSEPILSVLNSLLLAFVSMLIYTATFFALAVLVKNDTISVLLDIALFDLGLILTFVSSVPSDVTGLLNMKNIAPTSQYLFGAMGVWVVIAVILNVIALNVFKKRNA